MALVQDKLQKAFETGGEQSGNLEQGGFPYGKFSVSDRIEYL